MAKTKVIAVANQKGGVFMTMANDTNFRKTSSGCFTIAMNVLWKLSKQLRKT